MDLLVSSTRAERIGYLDDPFVLPCVGNDAYGPIPCGELALPLEGATCISCFPGLPACVCFECNVNVKNLDICLVQKSNTSFSSRSLVDVVYYFVFREVLGMNIFP